MLWRFFVALSFLFTSILSGDSGGPYQFVCDPQEDDPLDVSRFLDDKSQPLSFFVENVPVIEFREEDGKPMALRWKSKGEEDPHISIERIDDFPGQLCVLSYVRRDLLEVGVIRKSGLMLLVPAEKGQHRVVYLTQEGTSGLVETYSVETQKLVKGEVFLSVTCHYSGNGNMLSTQYFRWKDFKLTRHDIWAGKQKFNKEIQEAGWEFWHRGHWTDPARKASYNTVYRRPEDAKGGRSGHAAIKTEFEWVDEKLTAKSWKVLPEDWKWEE